MFEFSEPFPELSWQQDTEMKHLPYKLSKYLGLIRTLTTCAARAK